MWVVDRTLGSVEFLDRGAGIYHYPRTGVRGVHSREAFLPAFSDADMAVDVMGKVVQKPSLSERFPMLRRILNKTGHATPATITPVTFTHHASKQES